MTKPILFSSSFIAIAILFFFSCGPAAEDRSMMMSRAKQVQDSIANAIRMQMAEAEAPGPMQVQAAPMAAPAPVITHTNAAGETHTHAPGESHNH